MIQPSRVTGHASPAIDDLIGLPFQLGGRYVPGAAVQTGIDCYGVVMECFRRKGLTVPDPFASDISVMAAKAWILQKLAGWQRVAAPAAGVVVEFTPGPGVPAHVGCCLDAARFLHAARGCGVIISRLDREPWQGRIIGFYVYRGDHDAQPS